MDERVLAVQRIQDYIEKHLYEKISLAQLAEVSLYSPWYSYRIFKEFTGLTISDYIRKLRLSKSALKLRDEKVRIVNIAYEMGFKSVDGYQRAFKKEFNCNPYEYAKHPIPIYLFNPYGVKFRYKEVEKMERTKNVFIQVVNKPKRKVIIKRGVKATEYFEYCHEVGCDVWGLLTSIKGIGGEPVCLWLPEKYRKENTSTYVQGVEVDVNYQGIIPEGFEIIELPEGKYMMFQGEPFEEENYGEAIEEVQEAIKKYDPNVVGYRWDEENPRIQLEPIGTRGYIELWPIK
jgi:AraC-like DNA-binding protein